MSRITAEIAKVDADHGNEIVSILGEMVDDMYIDMNLAYSSDGTLLLFGEKEDVCKALELIYKNYPYENATLKELQRVLQTDVTGIHRRPIMITCKRRGQSFADPEELRQLARQSIVFRILSGGDALMFEQLCPKCMYDLQPSESDIGSIDVKAIIA